MRIPLDQLHQNASTGGARAGCRCGHRRADQRMRQPGAGGLRGHRRQHDRAAGAGPVAGRHAARARALRSAPAGHRADARPRHRHQRAAAQPARPRVRRAGRHGHRRRGGHVHRAAGRRADPPAELGAGPRRAARAGARLPRGHRARPPRRARTRRHRRPCRLAQPGRRRGQGAHARGTPVGDVVAYQPDPQQSTWNVFRVTARRTDAPPAGGAATLSLQQLYLIGQRTLQPIADDLSVRVNPRYGVWDQVALRVVPADQTAGLVLTPGR